MQRTKFHGWSCSTKKVAFAVTKSMRLYRKSKKSFLTLKDAKLILNTMLPEFMDALADFQKLPY